MHGLPRAIGLVLTLIGVAGAEVQAADPTMVVLKNPTSDQGETPVDVRLDRPLRTGIYRLVSRKDGTSTRGEVYEDGQTRHFVAVFASIPKGDQEFELSGPIPTDGTPAVELRKEGPNVALTVFQKPFATHHVDLGPKPILYPLIGPTGESFTRDFPMKDVPGEDRDHPHQRSFWFTHGKVNGIDFWTEQGRHGSIKQTAVSSMQTGIAVGILKTTDDWLGPDGSKVCEDERCLRVYATKEARVFDFDVTIKASNGPVLFGDTKEGMFGLRVASSMDVNRKKGGKITNAEGLTDLATWGKPSPWVDYVGPVEGETVGVAILNHPESFRYPTEWHVRDYGLFAANPFGWKDYGRKESGDTTLPAGELIRFRYRIILHRGDTAAAKLPAAFRAYSEPLKVEFR